MRQITVRGIPEDLQREIQSRARANGESLNKSVIRLLKQAVGLDRPEKKKRDLSALALDDSAVEANVCDVVLPTGVGAAAGFDVHLVYQWV